MRRAAALLVLLAACGAPPAEHRPPPERPRIEPRADAPRGPRVISIVGTNDLHGHVERVAVLGGYLHNLREAREADGGGVLVVDAGDMFQGTVESNSNEGHSVVEAYDVVDYDAAAIGNHEFDYGPVGPAVTPRAEDDEPRGALAARAEQASFPFLLANVVSEPGDRPADWGGIRPATRVEVAGVSVGIVGLTTEEMPTTTISANVRDLRVLPLAETAEARARALREQGADVIVVVVHAGGKCTRFDDPDDLSSCDPDQEVFALARALPEGLVDVIVGGHTHAGVAHRVNCIAIIESFAYGRAFGRVDVVIGPDDHVVETRIHPPRDLCSEPGASLDSCAPGEYEGAPVVADQRVREVIADDLASAAQICAQPSGLSVEGGIARDGSRESALGNLLADWILAARPAGDVALMNGGGVRSDFPPGELTYGAFYETFPFDNRFALVHTTVAGLERLYEWLLGSHESFMYLSGARIRARCDHGELDVDVLRPNGRPWPSNRRITIVMSDFLATGSLAELFGGEVEVEDGEPMRDVIWQMLRDRGGTVRASDAFDPAHPRVSFEGDRPIRCGE